MPRLDCEKCGGDLPIAYLSGYAVGETLLEGVRFEVAISKGKVTVRTHPEDVPYMKGLNEKKWLKEARTMAIGYDNFKCPTCGGEVAMLDA